jgi:flagellar biosynthesis/type III secretory pathway M-ring protein FliF/YscJ
MGTVVSSVNFDSSKGTASVLSAGTAGITIAFVLLGILILVLLAVIVVVLQRRRRRTRLEAVMSDVSLNQMQTEENEPPQLSQYQNLEQERSSPIPLGTNSNVSPSSISQIFAEKT